MIIEGLIKFTDSRIFSLPCVKGCGSPVETSAFNAEAPTEPAGETLGCRRQLGGIVRKFTDNRKGCPYGYANISISFRPKNR